MPTDVRTYRLSDILAERDKLAHADMIAPFLGRALRSESFSEFAETVAKRMAGKISPTVVSRSLLHLAGRMLSMGQWYLEAWRLAGNKHKLREHIPVPPWSRQYEDEYVPVEVEHVAADWSSRGMPGARMKCRILAGGPAGLVAERFFTKRHLFALARPAGFTASFGEYPFEHEREFMGFRLTMLVDAEKSGRQPYLSDVLQDEKTIRPTSFRKRNAALAKKRTPRPEAGDSMTCFRGTRKPCWFCEAGTNQCELATHPVPYELRMCPVCEREAWFDPLISDDHCMACDKSQRKSRRCPQGRKGS